METAPVIRLANDIAAQFGHLAPDVAAKAIADHITMFWEPRMRAELTQLAHHPDSGLERPARDAADLLMSQA